MNDALGDIYIYNAKAQGIDSDYTSSASFKNGTVYKLEDAYYAKYYD